MLSNRSFQDVTVLYPSTSFVECDITNILVYYFLLFIHPFLCLVDYDFVYNMLKLYIVIFQRGK